MAPVVEGTGRLHRPRMKEGEWTTRIFDCGLRIGFCSIGLWSLILDLRSEIFLNLVVAKRQRGRLALSSKPLAHRPVRLRLLHGQHS